MDLKATAAEVPIFLDASNSEGLTWPYSVIWKAMLTKINASLVTYGPFEYGELFSEKNGSGVFGSLIRNETQFSVGPMYFTERGVKWLDYTTVVLTDEWALISGLPKIYYTDYFSSIKSFELSLWKTLMVVLLCYALSRTVITHLVKQQKWNGWNFVKTFGNYLFSSTVVLVNYYHNVKSNRTYERLLWISWTMACMLLTLSFTGLILAKLAKKDEPFRYETLEDVLQHPNIKMALIENSSPYNDIQTSHEPIKEQIWNKVYREKTAMGVDELHDYDFVLEIMQSELVLMGMSRGLLINSALACGLLKDLYMAKEYYSESFYTLYMRKDIDVKIRNTIKFVTNKIAENHILMEKLDVQESLGRWCILSNTLQTSEILPLELKIYYLFLIISVFLMTCALCSLVIELNVSKPRSNRRRSRI